MDRLQFSLRHLFSSTVAVAVILAVWTQPELRPLFLVLVGLFAPFTIYRALRALEARKTLDSHRHIRFGLRSLFVVVMVAGLWLSFQVNWIRQRREFIAETGATIRFSEISGGTRPTAPGGLWVLGEQGVYLIGFVHKIDDEEGERIERLFPEAVVTVFTHF